MADRIEGYADAMFSVAEAEGAMGAVEEELFRFSRALQGSDELRSTLTDQRIPAARRQQVVEDLLGERAHPLTTALVSFVVGAGRARDLPAIVDRLVQRSAAERKKAVAEVTSAVPLDDEQRGRLAEALTKATGKQVEVFVTVDPDLMGGVVARIGDTVIDGSVRHRLDALKERL